MGGEGGGEAVGVGEFVVGAEFGGGAGQVEGVGLVGADGAVEDFSSDFCPLFLSVLCFLSGPSGGWSRDSFCFWTAAHSSSMPLPYFIEGDTGLPHPH